MCGGHGGGGVNRESGKVVLCSVFAIGFMMLALGEVTGRGVLGMVG